MVNSVEKTFVLSAATLTKEHEAERSAKTKLSWGIALLVLSTVLYFLFGYNINQNAMDAAFRGRDNLEAFAFGSVFLLLAAFALSVIGTVLLIVGIVQSVRYGKRVAAVSKCKLRVSSNRIYGATYNRVSGTATEFYFTPEQLTAMNVVGDTLNFFVGSALVTMRYLAHPTEAYSAVCLQRELLDLPPLPTDPMMMTAPSYSSQPAGAMNNAAISQKPAEDSGSLTKFCTECGCQIPASSRFCPKCGAVQA